MREIQLGTCVFNDDCLEVAIDVTDMSDRLKKQVDEAVRVAKMKASEKNKKCWGDHFVWSDRHEVICTCINVRLEPNKKMRYWLLTGLIDSKDEKLEADATMEIEMLGFEDELKKLIINSLLEKFFY